LEGYSSCEDRAAIVRKLIDARLDVNNIEGTKKTALHMAMTRNPTFSLVHALLEAGADVLRTDEHGRVPIEAADMSTDPTILSLLITKGEGKYKKGALTQVLSYATMNDKPEILAVQAVNNGADPNKGLFPTGLTPLYYALLHQKVLLFNALLNNGANPNITVQGAPLFEWALFNENEAYYLALIRAKANMDVTGKLGSMLGTAIYLGKADRAEVMLAHGANPHGKLKLDFGEVDVLQWALLAKQDRLAARIYKARLNWAQ
jgi:ankyrin repeat protein